MVAFVLRLVTTSPSSKYKSINSRIFYRIVSSYMQIATSLWKVCLLFIKFKKRTRLSLQQRSLPSVLYMSYLLPTFTWPHHSTSAVVWVQKTSFNTVTLYWNVCTKPEESEWSCICVLCTSILSPCLRVSGWILKVSWWSCIDFLFIILE